MQILITGHKRSGNCISEGEIVIIQEDHSVLRSDGYVWCHALSCEHALRKLEEFYYFEELKEETKPTLIELIMERLGVVEGEEFIIKEFSNLGNFYFKNNRLRDKNSGLLKVIYNQLLGSLVCGECTILKISEEIEIEEINDEIDKLLDILEDLRK